MNHTSSARRLPQIALHKLVGVIAFLALYFAVVMPILRTDQMGSLARLALGAVVSCYFLAAFVQLSRPT